jgi:hypothetical protein
MSKQAFQVPVTFKFAGVFNIVANSQAEAEQFAQEHCGMVLGGNIHSSLPEEAVNWDFPTHPDKVIGEAP